MWLTFPLTSIKSFGKIPKHTHKKELSEDTLDSIPKIGWSGNREDVTLEKREYHWENLHLYSFLLGLKNRKSAKLKHKVSLTKI